MMTMLTPRHAVRQTPADQHGAVQDTELAQWGLAPDDVIDFSVNSNPYGPAPGVRQAIQNVALDRYPDPAATELRCCLASLHGVDNEQVLVGSGSIELIWLIAQAYLDARDRVFISGPTFGEYRRAVGLAGAQIAEWRASPASDFAVDVTALRGRLAEFRPKLVFLCNPNNPTGSYVPRHVITAWATQHPATLFVVDEAYIEFMDDGQSVIGSPVANILVLRSMTKAHGLAGLRLGYAVGSRAVIDALERVCPPWHVNAFAQAAGIAALNDDEYLTKTLREVRMAYNALVNGLQLAGLLTVPSVTHYGLVKVGDGAAFRQRLLPHGLVVRDCASFGLPDYVRIASRRLAENQRLLVALGKK